MPPIADPGPSAHSPRGVEDGYTLVVCNRIDILTAKPYVEALVARGVTVHVACTRRIAEAVAEHLCAPGERPRLLDDLSRATRSARVLHNLLCVLFEGNSRSRNLRKDFLRQRAGSSRKIRLALALSRLFPKLPPRALNALVGRWVGRWLDNPFPTRRVLAVSHVTTPHLLCARGLDVITLNESWDHAGGKSAAYPSRAVIAWNEDIGRDWQRLQGADEVLVGFPVKLAYACDSHVAYDPSEPTAMYAVGSCAIQPDWYDEELKLIEAICVATREAGSKLLIKPRPSGPQPDLPDFSRRHPHVRLGRATSILGPRDYFLDADYNRTRLEEMSGCSLVINTITTFSLDAACAGLPVLQLDLRGSGVYPSLSRAQHNYHLDRYLLNEPGLCLRPEPTESIAEPLAGFLRRPDPRAEAFRDKLRSWIVADVPTAQRIAAVVDRLVERPVAVE